MKKVILISVALLVMLLSVGGFAIFRTYFERIETKRSVESAIYYREPMSGMIRTLKKMNMPARYEVRGLLAEEITALDTDVSLVLFNRDYELTEAQAREVLDWVDRGGQVVLASDNHYEFVGMSYREDEAQEDVLLQMLGLQKVPDYMVRSSNLKRGSEIAYRFGPGREILVEFDVFSRFNFVNDPVDFPAFGREATYTGEYGHEFRVQPDHIKDQVGLMFLHLKHGQGSISVFHDLLFLHNRYIIERRNAELVVRTMARAGTTREMVFSYLRKPRTLLQDLYGDGWLLVVSAVISLLLWIWNVVPRNGPIVGEPPPERRSLAEHVLASARFMWNHRVDAALVEPTRLALLERIRQTHAEWFTMKPGEQYRLLSEVSHLPMNIIHEAMNSETESLKQDPDAFLRIIRSLEHIRRSL